jgi:hypothetical protein
LQASHIRRLNRISKAFSGGAVVRPQWLILGTMAQQSLVISVSHTAKVGEPASRVGTLYPNGVLVAQLLFHGVEDAV